MAVKMAAILDFTKSQIYRKNEICKYFFVTVVEYNTIKHFLKLLLATFYKFLHRKKVKICIFVKKMACSNVTFDVISRYHSNWLSPNFAKMCLTEKYTATENGKS